LGKVVYTPLSNFQSATGETYALIDSNLDQPCGLAYDTKRGYLYVADRGAKSIFRYTTFVDTKILRDGTISRSLSTDSTRLTILKGHGVEWVTVDDNGDVFYSANDTKNVNKISADTMSVLSTGAVSADSLQVVSEKEMEGAASGDVTKSTNAESTDTETDTSEPTPKIEALYESSANPHVSTPAGLATDGLRLVWGNGADGQSSGSVVLGQVNPQFNAGATTYFKATALSNISDAVSGVCKANGIVLFTTTSGELYGVSQEGGSEYAYTSGLTDPKGCVWDGDNTAYVASDNQVYSFAAGVLTTAASLTSVVAFEGAFGVAVLTESDEAFASSLDDGTSASDSFLWNRNSGGFDSYYAFWYSGAENLHGSTRYLSVWVTVSLWAIGATAL
jgi:hypothetical protein